MPNVKVSIVRLCKTEAGWRRYPVCYAKNGKIKAGFVTVHGSEREYAIGRYQLRFYDGRKPIYEDVGESASEAVQARIRKANLLVARDAAKTAGVTLTEDERRPSLRSACRRFLEAAEARGAMEMAEVSKLAIAGFLESAKKTFADEIKPEDLLRFQRDMREAGYSDRTIFNRYSLVRSFLLFCGLSLDKIAPKKYRPRYEKKLPEIYTAAEMEKFFSSIKDERLTITYAILLQCGLREQEAMYLEWVNVDIPGKVLRVRSNPAYGFKVKDAEERDVPIPGELAEKMTVYRKKHSKDTLVCGTKSDCPHTHLLRALKRMAGRLGLGCGNCEGCKRERERECERWYLHRFRSTYLTNLLRGGFDVRTVQRFAGHSDMESTMRYLRPAENEEVRGKLDAIKWS